MLKWDDKAIVLSSKLIAEDTLLLSVFTQNHGKHLGVIKKTRKNSFLQSGNYVSISWQARLDNQLGYFKSELITPFSSYNLDDNLNLSMITSLCALVDTSLLERQEYYSLFMKTLDFFTNLNVRNYCLWELDLLKNSGFELDLSKCAVSGDVDNLSYVSPKTGRAISKDVGLPWHSKLLKYPDVFKNKNATDYIQSLELTGFFLQNNVVNKMPDARARLLKRLENCKIS